MFSILFECAIGALLILSPWACGGSPAAGPLRLTR
ncbi:MAG: SPW repeat protein [Gammaproteobacteria bacterium]|nr:SPW repeat protein [Gammaproteobacteria bacterium]